MATSIKSLLVIFILIAAIVTQLNGEDLSPSESENNHCSNKAKAFNLKVITFFSVLVTALLGGTVPIITVLQPDGNAFSFLNTFTSGILLATGLVHVLPESIDSLSSLPDYPWNSFPFGGFIAMLSALVSFMIHSISATYIHQKKAGQNANGAGKNAQELVVKYKITAIVLEMGIVLNAVVLGVSLGASSNVCSLKPHIGVACFHILFEGLGLGARIAQADFSFWKKSLMVCIFAATTPIGIFIGILASGMYRESSPRSILAEGLPNAASAGILIQISMVLVAEQFLGGKLQGSIKTQFLCYASLFIGAGLVSMLSIWVH